MMNLIQNRQIIIDCDDYNTLFYNCSMLTSLDISDWDISNWDISKVTKMDNMFVGCKYEIDTK